MSNGPLPQVPVKDGIKLNTPKVCGTCKESHMMIPKDSPFQLDYYWFNCECHSTLVVSEDMIHTFDGKES